MEQITRSGGVLYYGALPCADVDEAYDYFHEEYNSRMGKAYGLYLENIGKRTERIHEFGFVRPYDDYPEKEPCFGHRPVKYHILGLIGIHYCRIVGIWDMPKLNEGQQERWVEWAFTRGMNGLRLAGRKDGTGRTGKQFRKRYR